MKVDVVYVKDFYHGSLNAAMGKTDKLEKGVAEELERAGLLRIKAAPIIKNAVPASNESNAGKAPDDGAGQPSSALPAAQASQPKTLSKSGDGSSKTLKIGT